MCATAAHDTQHEHTRVQLAERNRRAELAEATRRRRAAAGGGSVTAGSSSVYSGYSRYEERNGL